MDSEKAIAGKRFDLLKSEAHCLRLELTRADDLAKRAAEVEKKAYFAVGDYVRERLKLGEEFGLRFVDAGKGPQVEVFALPATEKADKPLVPFPAQDSSPPSV